MFFFLKVIIASLIISFSSWLSGKRPDLAGYIIALPISTMLVLVFSRVEYGNPDNAVRLAQSIFAAIPMSLLFFVPFLIAKKTHLSFWSNYILGIVLITIGYFILRILRNPA